MTPSSGAGKMIAKGDWTTFFSFGNDRGQPIKRWRGGGRGGGGDEGEKKGRGEDNKEETAGELGIWILRIRLANRNRKIKKTGVKNKKTGIKKQKNR